MSSSSRVAWQTALIGLAAAGCMTERCQTDEAKREKADAVPVPMDPGYGGQG